MRKVLFKKWNHPVYSEPDGKGTRTQIEKGHWDEDFKHKGTFLGIGVTSEELGNGNGCLTYSVILVENEDHTIDEVIPSNILFTD